MIAMSSQQEDIINKLESFKDLGAIVIFLSNVFNCVDFVITISMVQRYVDHGMECCMFVLCGMI